MPTDLNAEVKELRRLHDILDDFAISLNRDKAQQIVVDKLTKRVDAIDRRLAELEKKKR